MDFLISDYLEFRGDLSFSVDEFSDTDAIVLCQTGYVHFDGILETATDDLKKIDFYTSYSFSDLRNKILTAENKHELMNVGLMNKKIPELFLAAGNTERFKDVRITGFINKMEDEKDPSNPEQFAAMVFLLNSETICVVFRGTDDSIKGWKEDCNLATTDAIPAQLDALEYLDKVMDSFPDKKIIVAGHSKGGNIAMYASAFVSEEKQKRISALYNLDGPGFSTQMLEKPEMLRIKPFLHSWYPHQSMVGMLFYHYPENYKIIKSSAKLILQHDLATWLIHGKNPAQVEEFSGISIYLNKTFNNWYEGLPENEKRKQFINALFSILECSSKETLSEMIGDVQTDLYSAAEDVKSKDKSFVQKTGSAVSGLTKLISTGGINTLKSVSAMTKGTFDVVKDAEQRQILMEIGSQLLKASVSSAKDMAKEKIQEREDEKEQRAENLKESVMNNITDAKKLGKNLLGGLFKK